MGLLVDEAHHRFFNGLQLIVSETNGIMRDVRDRELRDRLAALQERVSLLADVNRQLAGPFGPCSVSAAALARLGAALAASYDRAGALIEIVTAGGPKCPEMCRTLMLLTAELMTNALKHGPRGRRLRVGIQLTATSERIDMEVISDAECQATSARPRIATALAEAAGGALDATVRDGRFHVSVSLPGR